MAGPYLYDRVKETTTTTGTGTITLAGAASGFRSFSVVGDGNTCYYAIHGGTEWEVGIGTYTASGTTLSRTTVQASSNSNNAVNFSAGTKDVFLTSAADLLNRVPMIGTLTRPVNSGYSWVNQGTATLTEFTGGMYLAEPAGAASGFRIRVKSAPATPYVITAAILARGNSASGSSGFQAGLLFRQSSDGKLHFFGHGPSTTAGYSNMQSSKYTNETTFSAAYKTIHIGPPPGALTFFRIADDGTNRKCSYSQDGMNFYEFDSIGRTDFLTADQVGFAVRTLETAFGVGLTIFSWRET